MSDTDEYQVSFEGFTHISIEAEDEDKALKKARERLRSGDMEIDNERVEGPF